MTAWLVMSALSAVLFTIGVLQLFGVLPVGGRLDRAWDRVFILVLVLFVVGSVELLV